MPYPRPCSAIYVLRSIVFSRARARVRALGGSHVPFSSSSPYSTGARDTTPPTPSPTPIPTFSPSPISVETLHRLHRLSALHPPPSGSVEERELLDGLSELVGLMELVKGIELPMGAQAEERGELLAQGVGEVLVGQAQGPSQEGRRGAMGAGPYGPSVIEDGPEGGGKGVTLGLDGEEKDAGVQKGRELLGWATNRVGDYYASRLERKTQDQGQ